MKIADKVYILGKEVEVELREAEKNKRNTGQEKKSKSEIKYLSSKTVKAGNEILENKQRKKNGKKKFFKTSQVTLQKTDFYHII